MNVVHFTIFNSIIPNKYYRLYKNQSVNLSQAFCAIHLNTDGSAKRELDKSEYIITKSGKSIKFVNDKIATPIYCYFYIDYPEDKVKKIIMRAEDYNMDEKTIDKFNAIGYTSFQMPIGNIPVYCTNCKHFRLDDEEIPYCPYEEKECDIRDCEDSRPLRERPMYEERE